MKTIISTDHCYEGYDADSGCWSVDTYSNLDNATEIDSSTIEWSQSAWEDEKDYFVQFIESEIKEKEKKGSPVVSIVMGGRVGLWNGSPTGGKALGTTGRDIAKLLEMDVDSIDVKVDDDGEIFIAGHHHDGSHSMNIYLVTEKELKNLKLYRDYEVEGINGINYADAIIKIVDNLETLKLEERNGFFSV